MKERGVWDLIRGGVERGGGPSLSLVKSVEEGRFLFFFGKGKGGSTGGCGLLMGWGC